MSYIVCSKKVPSLFDELQETLTLESDKDNKCSILRRKYFNTEASKSCFSEEKINGPVTLIEEDIFLYYDEFGLGIINFKTGTKVALEKRIREKFASRNLEVENVSLEKELKVPNLEYFLKVKVKGLGEFKICIDFNSKESSFRCLTTFGIDGCKECLNIYDNTSFDKFMFIDGEEFLSVLTDKSTLRRIGRMCGIDITFPKSKEHLNEWIRRVL